MFNAHFSSKVQYGLEIIGTARKEILHKLQVKQNRALKILFNKDFYTPTKKLHHELKVLMVEDMYKYNMGKFVYKQQIGLLPDVFENHFTTVKATHDHMTRQNDHLQTNTTSLNEHAQKKSNVKAAKIWNQIPKDIRNANTLSIFKEQYKQYLLEHYNTEWYETLQEKQENKNSKKTWNSKDRTKKYKEVRKKKNETNEQKEQKKLKQSNICNTSKASNPLSQIIDFFWKPFLWNYLEQSLTSIHLQSSHFN